MDNSELEAVHRELDARLDRMIEGIYKTQPASTHLRDAESVDADLYKRHTIESVLRIRLSRMADGKVIQLFARANPGAVGAAGASQVGEVAAQPGEERDAAVEVVGPDERDHHAGAGARRRAAGGAVLIVVGHPRKATRPEGSRASFGPKRCVWANPGAMVRRRRAARSGP
jgi:hypothetical protein